MEFIQIQNFLPTLFIDLEYPETELSFWDKICGVNILQGNQLRESIIFLGFLPCRAQRRNER